MEPKPDRDVASLELASKPTPLEWSLAATLVDETYRVYLGRLATPNEVEHALQTIRDGLAPAAFVDGVKNSEEARIHSTITQASANSLVEEPRDQDRMTLVEGLYRGFLRRSAKPGELEFWAAASGMSFVHIARKIRDSEEAFKAADRAQLQNLDPESAKVAVDLMYQVHLGRRPNDSERETWSGVLVAGRSLESCVAEIAASREAQSIRLKRSRFNLGGNVRRDISERLS